MTETPEDIRAAAIAVVDRGYNVGLIDAVAEALMAERERCARIAANISFKEHWVTSKAGQWVDMVEDGICIGRRWEGEQKKLDSRAVIAAAIRSNPEAPHT